MEVMIDVGWDRGWRERGLYGFAVKAISAKEYTLKLMTFKPYSPIAL